MSDLENWQRKVDDGRRWRIIAFIDLCYRSDDNINEDYRNARRFWQAVVKPLMELT